MVRNTTSRSERIKLIQTVKVLRAKNRDLTQQIKVLQEEVQSLNQAAVAAQKRDKSPLVSLVHPFTSK